MGRTYLMSASGRIGMVPANGALSSQNGGEGDIRKAIIEDDLMEGIVAMPPSDVLSHTDTGFTLVPESQQKTISQDAIYRCPQYGHND